MKEIFAKHPEIASKIKIESAKRYSKMIRDPLHQQRRKEIEDLNKKSAYKIIKIEDKKEAHDDSEEVNQDSDTMMDDQFRKASIPELHNILKKKIEAINDEMGQFSNSINDFSLVCDQEFESLLQNLDTIQNVMKEIN